MWPDLNCWMFYYNSSKHVYLFIVQPWSCSWLGSFFNTLDFWSNSCSSFVLLTVLKGHSRVNFPSKPRKCAKSPSPDTIYASSIWDAPANASCFASLKHAPSSTFCPPLRSVNISYHNDPATPPSRLLGKNCLRTQTYTLAHCPSACTNKRGVGPQRWSDKQRSWTSAERGYCAGAQ